MSKNNWMKKSLMGSTTMPLASGGGFSFLTGGHVHKDDGSCCGHDHGHHHHNHSHHDHDHDEDGNCTDPKGGCC